MKLTELLQTMSALSGLFCLMSILMWFRKDLRRFF